MTKRTLRLAAGQVAEIGGQQVKLILAGTTNQAGQSIQVATLEVDDGQAEAVQPEPQQAAPEPSGEQSTPGQPGEQPQSQAAT